MSAKKKNQESAIKLETPRFEDGRAFLVAGFRRSYTPETMNQIPDQWKEFIPYIGKVPGQTGNDTYGLSFIGRGSVSLSYISGVEVSSCDNLAGEFSCVSVPEQKYAVFTHREHVSRLWETCNAIQAQWFPESGYEPARPTGDAPDFYERYTESFDPKTGMGGIEVWVPVKS